MKVKRAKKDIGRPACRRRICGLSVGLLLVLLLHVFLLAGCQTQGQTDIQTAGENLTNTDTGAKGEAPTEESTEALTEMETKAETPAETGAESPTDEPADETDAQPVESKEAGLMDFDFLTEENLASYFVRAANCQATLESDPEEGTVVALSSTGVTAAGQSTPQIFFKYQQMSQDMGEKEGETVIGGDTPCLVLKVKVQNLWAYTAQAVGCKTLRDTGTSGVALYVPLASNDEWQYICFDFSDYTYDSVMVKLSMEVLAGGNGECLLVSEARVCSKEQAAAYVSAATYPVPDRTADDYTLKVLQFNIQTENGCSTPFPLRADMYRAILDTLQPDTVGMEEVTTTWRTWLDSFVFNDSYASVGEPRTPGGEACPIYYRTDVYDLVDSGTFWLSATPDVPGSMVENCNYPRICTWAILRDKATGQEFVHLNTHLDHNGSNSATVANTIRRTQVQVILTFIQTLGDRPMVLTGDFNSGRVASNGSVYAYYKQLTGLGSFTAEDGTKISGAFSDTRLDAPVTVPEDQTATMVKYYEIDNAAYNPARQPIDYIFYTPARLEALSYQTFIAQRDGFYLSDHLGVLCEYRFR